MFSLTLTQISYADHPVNRATDDQHSLTMQEIIKKLDSLDSLDSYDVSADRIKHYRVDKMKGLYVVDAIHEEQETFKSFNMAKSFVKCRMK